MTVRKNRGGTARLRTRSLLEQQELTAGVVHPNGPLTDQPWGYREFAALDSDGNLIKFGERTEQ